MTSKASHIRDSNSQNQPNLAAKVKASPGLFFGPRVLGSSPSELRWFLRAKILLPGIAVIIAGCSLFTSSSVPTANVLRYVIAGHAGVKSAEILKTHKAQRFVGRLAWPVKGGKVYSRFGPRRGRFHAGIDIPAERGTPIVAACSGKIEFAGENVAKFGTVAVLRCAELVTLYAHADELLVTEGEDVKQGTQIGTVGDTGNANGPHLHFETRVQVETKFISINPQLFYP